MAYAAGGEFGDPGSSRKAAWLTGSSSSENSWIIYRSSTGRATSGAILQAHPREPRGADGEDDLECGETSWVAGRSMMMDQELERLAIAIEHLAMPESSYGYQCGIRDAARCLRTLKAVVRPGDFSGKELSEDRTAGGSVNA